MDARGGDLDALDSEQQKRRPEEIGQERRGEQDRERGLRGDALRREADGEVPDEHVMEARGIEPRSEPGSETAPTCVGGAYWSCHPGTPPAQVATSPSSALMRFVQAPNHTSPTLRYVSAASGGLPLTQVREAEAYAASARFELAVVQLPVV